ncbi:MAG: hypothetical protein ACFCUE_11240 [Candidatus Bathyarchaeia archaeon]|jgi:hypothetical protein
MRINFARLGNFTRLGLILMIIGAVLLFNFWTASLPWSSKMGSGYVDPDETLSYGLFMAPVGLGNLVIESDTLVPPTPPPNANASGGPIRVDGSPTRVEFEAPFHLVVVSPSNVTLVDKEIVTPHTVQIDFEERGEYIVHGTNRGNESYPLSVSIKFPQDSDVENRESDKFLVSLVLTVSGFVLFCLGLSTSLFLKLKTSNTKIIKTVRSEQRLSSKSIGKQIGGRNA